MPLFFRAVCTLHSLIRYIRESPSLKRLTEGFDNAENLTANAFSSRSSPFWIKKTKSCQIV